MVSSSIVPALEAAQFFANSAHSVQIFEAMSDGVTTSRALAEHTGASRSTVARILDEGESRGWVESEGSQYELTKLGEIMIAEFRAYLQTVEGVQQLGEAIFYLPQPAHEVDYRHFCDATITRSTPDNPAEPIDRGLDAIRSADEYRGLTKTAIPRYVEALAEGRDRGAMEVEGVIESSFFEVLRNHPERTPPWHTIAPGVWVYDGTVPLSMHIVDQTVLLWLSERREEGLELYGLLESTNSAVLSWAESMYEAYRADSAPLDPAMLPEAWEG
jgi:predicted transcriptional regulator